ncbi:syntaxin-2-like [Phycodurus eques]|uniref:syntaxin-2-like n=1 Tax=Phycodurus eques TaxID=693459 RepID=UPI002ACDFA65|nr:syntaxin-2-like [Phycodurus eques]XP_061555311.1 syntaxin-2-like [Phycodurus eques]XP_061555312.1 syntaxin-2-like [Phycodurus eques]
MAHTTGGKVVMEEFFKTVGELRSLIQKMSCQVDEVEKRQSTLLASSNPDKKCRDELELLNKKIKTDANLFRAKLKTLQDAFPADCSDNGTSVMQRIRNNQHTHLTRCFAELMTSHHNTQVAFREKCKGHIKRQLQIVDKVTTDEELEEMLNCHNVTIFITDIVDSGACISSKALSDIKSRHEDIIHLEASIRELHEILADTAMLLEIQGELVNSIEKNVASAAEYVDESREETQKAVTYKKNPYKILSLPRFFRSFRRQTVAKTVTGPNTSD